MTTIEEQMFAGNLVSNGLSNETVLVEMSRKRGASDIEMEWFRAVDEWRAALPLVLTGSWRFKADDEEEQRWQTSCILMLLTKRPFTEEHRRITARMMRFALEQPPHVPPPA